MKFLFTFLLKSKQPFFSLWKMVESEKRLNNHKTLKTSIGAIMKSPEMLKFVPSCLKTKRMCKSPVKKLLFIIMYVTDQCKTQEVFNKFILENNRMLKFIPDSWRNKKTV